MSVGSLPEPVTGRRLVQGPELGEMMQAIALAPPQLLEPGTALSVLISDLLYDLDGTQLDGEAVARLEQGLGASPDARELTGLLWWLARTPAVRAHLPAVAPACGGASRWFLAVLNALVAPLIFPRTGPYWREGGREELSRAFLAVGGWQPAGESHAVALDAWLAVSTAHQRALYAAMVKEREAAEAFAAALADRRAKEAAANYANY